jgi:hypothetical protein
VKALRNDILRNFCEVFDVGDEISRDDIKAFFLKFYEDIGDASLAWRIYDLKRERLIVSEGGDMFSVIDKDEYADFPNESDAHLVKILMDFNEKGVFLKSRFGHGVNVNVSVWNTAVLNHYTVHQTYMNYSIVEVDRDRVGNLHLYLKDKQIDAFMMKDIKGLSHYLSDQSVVVAPLPSRSPLENRKSVRSNYVGYPKVEKVLVDIFAYNDTLLPYDISEIENIYRNMYKRHIIKNKTVLQYARIRGMKTRGLVEDMLVRIGELHHD